jgi:hypothetical protein
MQERSAAYSGQLLCPRCRACPTECGPAPLRPWQIRLEVVSFTRSAHSPLFGDGTSVVVVGIVLPTPPQGALGATLSMVVLDVPPASTSQRAQYLDVRKGLKHQHLSDQ